MAGTPHAQQHKMLSRDWKNMEGVCSLCGPVKIMTTRGRCANKVAEIEQTRTRRYRGEDGDTRIIIADARAMTLGKACAICGRTENLVIDHCHKSGKIRDVLCSPCNTGIGIFKEDEALMLRAIEYIRVHA
jgi:hypothetical protein